MKPFGSVIIKCLGIAVIIAAFSGCIKDYNMGPGPEGNKKITFTIQVPDRVVRTRALPLAGADERHIETIDILLFDFSDDSYIGTVEGTIEPHTDPNKKNVSFDVAAGHYNMVLLANCRSSITGLTEGMDRADVEKALKLSVPLKWNTIPGSAGYLHIPMYGELNNADIVDENSLSGKTVGMSRLLARIDVKLTAQAKADFELTGIHVYHRNTEGQLMPTSSNWFTSGTYPYALAPSIPTGSNVKGPISYTKAAGEIVNDECIGEIYLFEAMKGVPANHPTYYCMVIEGIHRLAPNTKSYYRLDFTKKDSNPVEYIDLLRNHNYSVTITSVNSTGLPTEEDAYNSVSADIEMTVVNWLQGANIYMEVDEQKYLWISDVDLYGDTWEDYFELMVDTNVNGWTAVFSTSATDPDAGDASRVADQSWTGPQNGFQYIGFDLRANPSQLVERVTYLHIKAERLSVVVRITQAPGGDVS